MPRPNLQLIARNPFGAKNHFEGRRCRTLGGVAQSRAHSNHEKFIQVELKIDRKIVTRSSSGLGKGSELLSSTRSLKIQRSSIRRLMKMLARPGNFAVSQWIPYVHRAWPRGEAIVAWIGSAVSC